MIDLELNISKTYPLISKIFQRSIYTYIKSTHMKFHEGAWLCLGAMAILVSMGRHKNHQNVDFFANQCI